MFCDVHISDYGKSVVLAGGLPVELTRDADPYEVVEILDGLILSGGADIDPATYGAEPDDNLGSMEIDRDEWEFALLNAARNKGIAVLGICRGLQLINVACGGTLRQHVSMSEGSGHPNWHVDGSLMAHGMTTADGSVLRQLLGESFEVNSLHHQTILELGSGLTASALAPDGVIEGIELRDEKVLAVQWHPELLTKPNPVFKWLVEEASANS